MPQLPWNLDFSPDELPPGVTLALDYDLLTERLSGTLVNGRADAVALDRIRLSAEVELPADGGSLWLQGRYMQLDAFVHRFGGPLDETYQGNLTSTDEEDQAHRFRSNEVMTISLVSSLSPCLLIGCVQPGRAFVDIEVVTDEDETGIGLIELVLDLRGIQLAAGETCALPAVLVIAGSDPLVLIDRFAAGTAAEMSSRVPSRIPTGWCSWYYFYNRVTEDDVVSNLDALASVGSQVDVVQVDDGFQSHTGDWLTPNEKFPSGMAALATKIRDAGFRPGLWLAPFVMHEDSAAFRDRPAMALKTPEGETLFVETWLGRCAVLDCTHPESEAWLREVISAVVHEWGYGYLKLDALAFAAQTVGPVVYHKPGTTAAAHLRRGLEIIRKAAGGETFILGCTCHFGPAIGLVDAMRVGPDVKALWSDRTAPSVKHAMRMTLQRNWMHGRWWVNDPDCLIVRDTDTQLSEAETRFLATSIVLSGGMVVLSDDLPAVSPARRDLAAALIPPPGVAASPVDPSEEPIASIWRAVLGEGRFLVGALNWSDEPRWVPRDSLLNPGEIAFDVFEGKLLGMGDRLLRPHEGVLLQIAARGTTPRVVGDTGHLTYNGLYQRQVSGRIQVRNDLPRQRTIAIEARGRVFEATLSPGEMRWFD